MQQPIQDAGVHVPGARKEMFEGAPSVPRQTTSPEQNPSDGGLARGVSGKEGATGPRLSDLWPEPDWLDLVQRDVLTPTSAAWLKTMRATISETPAYKCLAQWRFTKEQIDANYIDSVESFRDAMELVSANRAADEATYREAKAAWSTERAGGRPEKDLTRFLRLYGAGLSPGGRTIWCVGGLQFRDVLWAKALPHLGWPVSAVPDLHLLPSHLKNGSFQAIGVKGKERDYWTGDYHATYGACMEFCLAEHARRETESQAVRSMRKRSRTKSIAATREGPDYRNGADVTGDDLLNHFKLRAVQFGSSLSNVEKQRWLNETFDALCDLADVTGLPRKLIGQMQIKQPLALAFGARGVSGALAHFEPGLDVINLTRENGAGSLAHEWGHALDYGLWLFARRGKTQLFQDALVILRDGLRDYSLEPESELQGMLFTEWSKNNQWLRERTPAVEAAIALGYRVGQPPFELEPNDRRQWRFYEHAVKLTQTHRAGKYWATHKEMFARSFESYVQDALAAMGRSSPWLVHGTRREDLPAGAPANPYPEGEERVLINGLYSRLIALIHPSPAVLNRARPAAANDAVAVSAA